MEGKWIKSTETIANGGKTLNNIYNKLIIPSSTWTGDHDAYETVPFNFAITGDFTLMLNCHGVNLSAARNWVTKVQASGDGTNYTDLRTLTALTGALDNETKMLVYDYDSYGRAPYMRISLDPNGTLTAWSGDFIIGIVNH